MYKMLFVRLYAEWAINESLLLFQKYLDDNNLDYKNDSQDRIFLLQVKKNQLLRNQIIQAVF